MVSAFTWQCIGAWQDSQTTDEAVHLTAGRGYWQTGSFALNPEHPPLFKLWAAAPLLLMPQTQVNTSTTTWQSQNQWDIGRDYLYRDGAAYRYSTQSLLFYGRLQMILIWLGLVITLAVFCWRRWGAWPAVVATTTFAYDPTWLGHGHLVTNDVSTAFAYLGTFLALRWLLVGWSRSRLWMFGFIFGIAQVTKFSVAILWVLIPLVLIVGLWLRWPQLTWRRFGHIFMVCVLMTTVVAWLAYGGRWTRIDRDPRIHQLWSERAELVQGQNLNSVPPYTRFFVRLADTSSLTGRLLERAQSFTIPAYWYWRGFFSAASHNVYGHAAYVLGQTSEQGWWYYFPVALSVKIPVISLLLLVLAGGLAVTRPRRWWQSKSMDIWLLAVPPVFFLAWSMGSHINIGVRHIFPTYVFVPLGIAAAVSWLGQRSTRWLNIVGVSVVATTIFVTTLAWPNTIGYGNALAGGTAGLHRVLLDSNLDWNQDIIRLQRWLATHRITNGQIALFGSIPYAEIFAGFNPVPRDWQIAAGLTPSGTIIISAGILYDPNNEFHWLWSYRPTERIGSSILVFTFR